MRARLKSPPLETPITVFKGNFFPLVSDDDDDDDDGEDEHKRRKEEKVWINIFFHH